MLRHTLPVLFIFENGMLQRTF